MFEEKINRKKQYSCKWLEQTSPDALPFWIADGDYHTDYKIREELKDVASNYIFGYTTTPQPVVNSICEWYKKRYNVFVKNEWVYFLTGVVLEIRVILNVITKIDDGIILQTPVYHCFHHLIKTMHRKIIYNDLILKDNQYKIDFKDLENKFKEGHKVLILCSPHNPVGRIWNDEELSQLINLAKKYHVFIISDEIHSDINITNRPFISLLKYQTIYDKIFIVNAPSKAFNIAGLGISYSIIPNNELRNKFQEKVNNEFLTMPNVFGYNACLTAYSKGEEWINQQNIFLKNNYQYLLNFLKVHLPLVKVAPLEGTYLVWLDLSYTNCDSSTLQKYFEKHLLTVSYGESFSEKYTSFIRFNISCPLKQLQEGLKRLCEAINDATR